MPRTMDFSATRLMAFLMAAGVVLLAGAQALAQESATLIITANTERVLPPLTDDEELKKLPEVLEKELLRLKEENPNAYLIDAGNHIAMSEAWETAYNYTSAKLFDTLDYDAVHLDARDAILAGVGNVGYHYSPKDYKDRVFTSAVPLEPYVIDHPIALTVEKEGQPAVALVSLADLKSASGISAQVTQMREHEEAELTEAIAAGNKDNGLVVALSSMPAERRGKVFTSPEGTPDLVIDLRAGDDDPGASSNVRVLPAPETGEIHVVTLTRGSDGSLQEPKVERVRYLAEDKVAKLRKFPKPRLGMATPNMTDVVALYFNVPAQPVRVDRVSSAAAKELTAVEDPSVYQLELEGETVRLYRIFSQIPNYQRGEPFMDFGWPFIDVIVALNGDGSFRQMFARTSFPVRAQATSTIQAVNKLSGKDPATWVPDAELVAGLEHDYWLWATWLIQQTQAFDRAAYGEKQAQE